MIYDEISLPAKLQYRLSRARRIVENSFGIMSSRFWIIEKVIPLAPE